MNRSRRKSRCKRFWKTRAARVIRRRGYVRWRIGWSDKIVGAKE